MLINEDPLGQVKFVHLFKITMLISHVIKAWFPLRQLRPRQRPISSRNKAINVKDDCSTS